jgi:hypothetical protein
LFFWIQAPTDRDGRARVIERMYVHARSAASGDRSLQAAVAATKKVAEEVADDHLVFLLSDANLGRYVDGDVLIVVYCWLCFLFLVY